VAGGHCLEDRFVRSDLPGPPEEGGLPRLGTGSPGELPFAPRKGEADELFRARAGRGEEV
jgi:hypothetical protein